MRKLFTILALVALAVTIGAQGARADGVVDYTVTGTFDAITGFSSTSLSKSGDSFKLTFSVDSSKLTSSVMGMSNDITGVTYTYIDTTNPSLRSSGSGATVNFFTSGDGGLFSLGFMDGTFFQFDLFGPDGGITDTTPPALNTGGPFKIDDSLSAFGEITCNPFDPSCLPVTLGGNSVSGSVTATPTASVPEPSSLLLLGGGFLALGGFARKRLVTLF